ncbi:Erythronolide synthase [Catenulispora acidiphila DSM 44928]|uniref:Erythronolide synthase n=1 Tax=Catenulispora acidiphila (strain DSM 44928 / JCM 14897 / NBRC 102108 / NRRL B-24433 / ID139908) TaxID=479433 RepID=C7QKD1_CATAD|nr:type I polyketide synthase [Catenulispora acidiphila]ACU75205.1 Erythronolide synthase [Catenulispora acidiphila DSM 44928]
MSNTRSGIGDTKIAVVGIALRYPDAESPDELWRNVLAGRRAFRKLPDERMRAEDYYSPDPTAPDRHYSKMAAVLEGFEFDRVGYRIGGSTFRSTDMTHWLALDTVSRALEDAGFAGGEGLPRANTGVVIGNTLTGEFSRANLMRLRWPYVERTVGAALREAGWDDVALGEFLTSLEARYKAPFPPIDEDSLAGGLANTISGRICNYFDFGGGGYTVDGACSSSLLSVATVCNALASGQIDAAVAGGVDLSIDPFEVIGFAKTGALAKSEMKVYDKGSNGFWPGEGCGMLVLMRDEDAVAQGKFRYATINGWGQSSDGKGGITRPEASGHRRAISRAYAQAGFGVETVRYFEGHGTGTAVGDATELDAISGARRDAAGLEAGTAAISTVKGNFGHTKGAAGVAGLIKAILAVRHQVIPPATGHYDPHPVLLAEDATLHVPDTAELWPDGAPIRAGVSSMGFGGINAHLIVEHADGVRRRGISKSTTQLVRSRQDCEILLLDAVGIAELRGRVAQLAGFVTKLSFAELGDLAATLSGELSGQPLRAAIVASSPEQAEDRLGRLLSLLDSGARQVLDAKGGVFLGSAGRMPRLAFLFPGQGAGRRADGGALRRRFPAVDELYQDLALPTDGDQVATSVAQPRIVAGSVAAMRVLSALGISATGAAGHSLGELTALHWAGVMSEEAVLALAAERGRVMDEASSGGGAMASITASAADVNALLYSEPVVIAGYNSPTQTVVSGPVEAVESVMARAQARGLSATRISVSHAFHSSAVAPAAEMFGRHLAAQDFSPVDRTVVSTVTGAALPADTDVTTLLTTQMLDPVRFHDAVSALARDCDAFIEVGPGRILRNLATEIAPATPAVSIESDSMSLTGLFHAVAMAYVLGSPVEHAELFRDRYVKPLPLDKEFVFLASPAEAAPEGDFAVVKAAMAAAPASQGAAQPAQTGAAAAEGGSGTTAADALSVLVRLAAERAELPPEAVSPDSNPIDELHLSSITVGQIVTQAAKELGVTAVLATSAYATSTLTELAVMLEGLASTALADDGAAEQIAGVEPWVRAYAIDLVPTPPAPPAVVKHPVAQWEVFASDGHRLAEPLGAALAVAGIGEGVLLCLPDEAHEDHTELMITAVRAALSRVRQEPVRFVTVGGRRGAAGIAKTLHLEAPSVTTTVVAMANPDTVPEDGIAEVVTRITADAAMTAGFAEVGYEADGTRTVPILRPLATTAASAPSTGLGDALGRDDVLLVTGGGKGITAEAAMGLAQDSGASLALMGRSEPAKDPELAMNLERMRAQGIPFLYVQADVTAADEVKDAVERVRRTLGPVTAILHGAGRNEPRSLVDLDESTFRRTLAPKLDGLRTVLTAVGSDPLKLLITFGSIIGRAGLRGEGDYATANAWLTELTHQVAADRPEVRCLALEWSVWSGAGMGDKLGVLEALMRDGISPIPVAEGVGILKALLADPSTPGTVVIAGRAEGLPTITMEQRELPLGRFLERPRVFYPGVELVVDADLTPSADLYLGDHLLDGDLLFPAVLGMEAMSQAAGALTGHDGAPTLENVEFLRPIVVPVDGRTTLRVALLADGPDVVRAALRSSETGFQADHFRATLRYDQPLPAGDARPVDRDTAPRIPLDPAAELYGPVLFQGDRFQRLLGYHELEARGCVAAISNQARDDWFGSFHPADLILADPGTRDALMHSIQCCVPDATLLPASVERLWLADPKRARPLPEVTLHAAERSRTGDTYIYDIEVRDLDGVLVERWDGLTLQAVRKQDGTGPWLPALLTPYLERNVEPVFGRTGLRTGVIPDAAAPGASEAEDSVSALRRERTDRAMSWAVGRRVEVGHRSDGMPWVDGYQVSSSHGAGLTFSTALAGDRPVECDVEVAMTRTEGEWTDLLGAEGAALARLISTERNEDYSVAATRVWGAIECLSKSGQAVRNLTLDTVDGIPGSGPWAALRGGGRRIASFATTVRDTNEPLVFTVSAADAADEGSDAR